MDTLSPVLKPALSAVGSSPSHYSCAQCNHSHTLTNRDPVRCVKCGYRIMYKQRAHTPIACIAR